jgi:hypothetical protein
MILVFPRQAKALHDESVVACAFPFSRENIVKKLFEQYGEVPVITVIDANGGIIEFFSNPETQTWTIFNTSTTGCVNMLSSGGGVLYHVQPKPGEPS